MLELTRKVNEAIQIGDNVTVSVVHIGPDTVKLGLEGPGNPEILRKELKERDARSSQRRPE